MKTTDAAVWIHLGQSNAVGHSLVMRKEDHLSGLSHVFGLSREKNQSFSAEKLTWEPYSSAGMNLGETQDHVYSVPSCLASLWQQAKEAGEDLPDLYIVQIAIGAQGVTEKFMWYPWKERRLIPGPLGTADIALYPFTLHVLSLLDDSFRTMNKRYEILGIDWRGGEEDPIVGRETLENTLHGIYETMLNGFFEALGQRVPVALHRIVSEKAARLPGEKEGIRFVNREFERLSREIPEVSFVSESDAPWYDPEDPLDGLFEADGVHYTERVNRWAAGRVLEAYRNNR